jgi:hypothetical protein
MVSVMMWMMVGVSMSHAKGSHACLTEHDLSDTTMSPVDNTEPTLFGLNDL